MNRVTLKEFAEAHLFLEHSDLCVAIYKVIDGKLRVLMVSDGLLKLHAPGTTREELIEQFEERMYENVHPEDAVYATAVARDFMNSDDQEYEVVLRTKLYGKDEYATIQAHGYHTDLEDGSRVAVVIYTDVTKAVGLAEKNRDEYRDSILSLMGKNMDAMAVIDRDTHEVLTCNSAMRSLLPPSRAFDNGITYEAYFYGTEDRFDFARLADSGEAFVSTPDGLEEIILRVSRSRWDGQNAYLIKADRRDSKYFDGLTGLANMNYFRLRAENIAEEILSDGKEACVVFVDLNDMKKFNASFGFEAGDELLVETAVILHEEFPDALICRFADDHFVALSAYEGIQEKVEEVARRVRSASRGMQIGIRAGVCRYEGDSDIMTVCDHAQTAADSSDRVYDEYDASMEETNHRAEYIRTHIQEAVDNGWIHVYYQPVVRTLSGTFCSMEALARWIDPYYGFMNPAEFVSVLEDAHQIHILDAGMIRIIARDMRYAMDHGQEPIPVSFNLSRLDFMACDIFSIVEKALQDYRISRDLINIEITESIIASDTFIQEKINRFHEAGYEVWMDDFGSGYSSLNTLKDYEFDELKIDMVFLSSFTDRSRQIIMSTVGMAKSIGITTLAEGVETEEQFAFLREIGCEKAQGYFFGKPAPIKETIANMRALGYRTETHEEAAFYSRAGATRFYTNHTLAILHRKDDYYRFLMVNSMYQKELESISSGDLDMTERNLNTADHPFHDEFVRNVEKAIETGEKAEFSFPYRGVYLSMGIYALSTKGEEAILSVTLSNTNIKAVEVEKSTEEKEDDRQTILIVDDEESYRQKLNTLLSGKYNLIFAPDGHTAFQLLRRAEDTVALVMIDHIMPEYGGLEVVRDLRKYERGEKLPVILMSSIADVHEAAADAGADAFFMKKMTDDAQILLEVDACIRTRETQKEVAYHMLDHIPGGVFVVSADEKDEFLYVNDRMLDIMECDSVQEFRELTDNRFYNLIMEEDRERVQRSLKVQIRQGSGTYEHVMYRVRTKKGNIRKLDDFAQRVNDPVFGEVYYVFAADDDEALRDYNEKRERFEHFLESGTASGTRPYEAGYQGYIIWNLSKNESYLREEGTSFIPDELRDRYTYEQHCEYLSTLTAKQSDLSVIHRHSRLSLIEACRNNTAVEPFNLSYLIGKGWINIRSEMRLMEDPDTQDVYLLLQNYNDTNDAAYAKLMSSVAEDLYEFMAYLDVPADRAIVVHRDGTDSVRREMGIQQARLVVQKLLGAELGSVEEMVADFNTRKNEAGMFTYQIEPQPNIYKQITIKEVYADSLQYFVSSSDITQAVNLQNEAEKLRRREQAMIEAMAQDYLTVFEVDLESEKLTEYKHYDALSPDIYEAALKYRYSELQKFFAKRGMEAQYADEFLRETSIEAIRAKLAQHTSFEFVYESDNSLFTKMRYTRMNEEDGSLKRVLLGFVGVDDEVRRYNRLYEDSLTDALSGLKNRHGLRSDFESFVGKNIAVMLADVDHFKAINDTYGHETGDEAIRNYAQILKYAFMDENLYRYGGDEFLVIAELDEGGIQQALDTCVKLRQEIAVPGMKEELKVSGGYVTGRCTSAEGLRHDP